MKNWILAAVIVVLSIAAIVGLISVAMIAGPHWVGAIIALVGSFVIIRLVKIELDEAEARRNCDRWLT